MDQSRPPERGGTETWRADEILGIAGEEGLLHARVLRGPAPELPFAAFLVAALPYPLGGSQDPPAPPLDAPPLAALGSFARSHAYRTLATRLKAVASRLRGSAPGSPWKAADFRVLVNSRFPEKPLAAASGLGSYGRNGLIMVGGTGSACVLGALALPFRLERPASPKPAFELHHACASCRACVDACPTFAIGADGGVDGARCIQAWASREGIVPEEVMERWGDRLYGCDACLEACPSNRGGADAVVEDGSKPPGFLGRGVSIPFILESDPRSLKAALRGSALGLSWLSPEILKRNAAIAARVFLSDYPELGGILEAQKKSDQTGLSEAAAWSLRSIKGR